MALARLFNLTPDLEFLADVKALKILIVLLDMQIVGHKELRFLFPMTFVFTYLVAIGLEYSVDFFKIQRYWLQDKFT